MDNSKSSSKIRRKINPKFYNDLKSRLIEDIRDELKIKAPLDELNKRKEEIRRLAFKKVIFSDVDNENYSGKQFIQEDTSFIKKFIKENNNFFSFIILLRKFFIKTSFFSRVFFYFIALFIFFSVEYYLHYYPPFSPIPFNITFEDIVKNIPPFF
jgi:hypothetical protein